VSGTHITFSDAAGALDGIDGWLSEEQAHLLWDCAGKLPVGGRAVEIGSFRGRSTVITALALPDGATVTAIDPHAGNDRGPQEWEGKEAEAETDHSVFLANLDRAGVRDRVTHIRKFSNEAHADVEGDIDLLYIDGAHRYRPARADIEQWGDRVVAGGTMLIHDSFSSIGVTAAILATLMNSGEWEYVGRSGSMAQYRREPMLPEEQRGSRRAQIAQLPWFASNVFIKVLLTARLRPVATALGFPADRPWPY